nr:hypothetical protein AUSP0088_00072 [uncultured phage]
MGHFLDIISGYLGVCWSMLGKNEKMPQPLVNTGFTAFLCHERAGIRTPDNLIKSQVLKVPETPSFRRFLIFPWTLLGHYALINCFTV